MPYEVSWYLKGRIILTHLYGKVTLDDLRGADKQITTFLDSVSTADVVHSVCDAVDIETIPNNAFQLQGTQTYYKHPQLGWIVVYGYEGKLVNFISALITQVLKAKFRVLKSRAETLAFLQEHDKTLPELKR